MLTDKNEIFKKLGITIEDIFKPLPYNWVSIDETGRMYNYETDPIVGASIFVYHLTNGKPFDMADIDWEYCCWKRPVDESKWVGLLGEFWDHEDTKQFGIVGKLQAIVQNKLSNNGSGSYKINAHTGEGYTFFRPLTSAELREYLRRAEEAGIE